jgi:hypothetical protein
MNMTNYKCNLILILIFVLSVIPFYEAMTESYLDFYFKYHVDNIWPLRRRINETCVNPLPKEFIDWHKQYASSSIDSELLYYRIRDTKPLNILEIGGGYGLLSTYVLFALEENVNEGFKGLLTSVGEINQHLLDKSTLRDKYMEKGLFKFMAGNEITILETLLRDNTYDLIIINSDFDKKKHQILINNFLDPLVLKRYENPLLPALEIYFYTRYLSIYLSF